MTPRDQHDAARLERLNREGARFFSVLLPDLLYECIKQRKGWAEAAAIVAALLDRLRDDGLVVRIPSQSAVIEATISESRVPGPEGLQ